MIEGVEGFSGRVMHSHDFREAREFTGKNVLVVGGSYSAEDVALQCHKYGANHVTTCYRTAAMGFKWPDGVDERPLVTKLDNDTAHFQDGSTLRVDVMILCTGYLHHFPFLEDSLKLRTGNRLYPPGLYQGVAWMDNPAIMYLGMQDQFYTFSMFDAQAWWARDVIMGRIILPARADMDEHSAAWVEREEALEDAHQMIDFQADYVKAIMTDTDYPNFDVDLTVKSFVDWEHDKEHDITTYRNSAFRSSVTGTLAPVHHTPWLEALDDSMETFLATKS